MIITYINDDVLFIFPRFSLSALIHSYKKTIFFFFTVVSQRLKHMSTIFVKKIEIHEFYLTTATVVLGTRHITLVQNSCYWSWRWLELLIYANFKGQLCRSRSERRVGQGRLLSHTVKIYESRLSTYSQKFDNVFFGSVPQEELLKLHVALKKHT